MKIVCKIYTVKDEARSLTLEVEPDNTVAEVKMMIRQLNEEPEVINYSIENLVQMLSQTELNSFDYS